LTLVLFCQTLATAAGFLIVALALGSLTVRGVERTIALAAGAQGREAHLLPPQVGTALLAGFGTEALIGTVLGLLGILAAWSLVIVAVIALIVGRTHLSEYICSWLNVRHIHSNALVLAGVAFSLVLYACVFLSAMTPPHGWDELAYHFPQAEIIASGHLPSTVGNHYFYGNLPHLIEVLNAEGLAMSTDLTPHVLNVMLLGAFLLFSFETLRTLYGPLAGILSVVLLLLYEDLTINAATGYIDAATVSFELAALLSAAVAFTTRSLNRVAHSAMFIAFAVAAKYSALSTLAFLLVLAALGALLVRPSLRRLAAVAATAAGLVVVIAGYWYVENLVMFGNPTYPLLFGHKGIDQATYESLVGAIQQFGSRTTWDFLALPARFAYPQGALTFIAIAAAPLSVLVRTHRLFIAVLLSYWIWYMAYWFFAASHQLRFFMPAAIVAMILVAVAAVQLPREVLPALAVLAYVVSFVAYPQIGRTVVLELPEVVKAKIHASRLKYPLGLESQDEFLTRQFGCRYELIRRLDHLGASGNVVDNWSQYDLPIAHYIRDNRFVPFTSASRDPSEIMSELRRAGLKFLYVRPQTKRGVAENPDPFVKAYREGRDTVEEIILRHSERLMVVGDCFLYRLPV
jgi:hypothetical protein